VQPLRADWRLSGCLVTGCLLSVWVVSVFAGKVYKATASYQEGVYLVEVDALVSVPEPRVRELLTDYNHLGRVNPDIKISEILKTRKPGDYQVRTVTQACIWFFCKLIHQVQDVIEAADGSVMATIIPAQSDFRHGYARLDLWQEADGTRVQIRAEVEPDFWIPPLIGPWMIKRKLRGEAIETVQNLEQVARDAPQ